MPNKKFFILTLMVACIFFAGCTLTPNINTKSSASGSSSVQRADGGLWKSTDSGNNFLQKTMITVHCFNRIIKFFQGAYDGILRAA